jgi:YfiH family protein
VAPPLAALGVRHAFTTRHHGTFPGPGAPGGPFPPATCGGALAALGVEGPRIHYARQVHGADCLVVDDVPPGLAGTADALATSRPGRPLAVFTADCVPLVLADRRRRALAVVHAGWRGTVAGIAGRVVAALAARFGVPPERLQAAVGPAIGPCCYEVDAPVVEPLLAAFPAGGARWLTPVGGRPGRFWLDLWRATGDQLEAAGVPPEAVWTARLCTACRGDLFFSYRRERGGGRLVTLAALEGVD